MVWPFTSSTPDPLKDLDPDLRKFLDSEAKRSQPSQSIPQRRPEERPKQLIQKPKEEPVPPQKPLVPRASLFQDGRYADIWKTYQPDKAKLDARSDNEIIREMTQNYEDRKRDVAEIAKENCAFEEIAEYDCFKYGSWHQKLWMCRDETRALDRCHKLQTKFLYALGYMTEPGRDPFVEDQIQGHADKLYQQMIAHEKAIKEAKEQGLPPPEFQPVMSRNNLAKVLGVKAPAQTLAWAERAEQLAKQTPEPSTEPNPAREEYENTIKDMSPDERSVEDFSRITQGLDKIQLAKEYTSLMQLREQERQQRKAEGTETFGDKMRARFVKTPMLETKNQQDIPTTK